MVQTVKNHRKWVTIKDKPLITLILESYADRDKRKILQTAEKPKIILGIIATSRLPQTSTYRKINSLIKNGLLIPDGKVSVKLGKTVHKYVSLFENLEINIVKNEISLRGKICDDSHYAILNMMREKIIKSRQLSSMGKELSKSIHRGFQNNRSDSVIPYLVKERVLKI